MPSVCKLYLKVNLFITSLKSVTLFLCKITTHHVTLLISRETKLLQFVHWILSFSFPLPHVLEY